MFSGIACYVSFALVYNSPAGLISDIAIFSALAFIMFISLFELYKEVVNEFAKGNRLELHAVFWFKLIRYQLCSQNKRKQLYQLLL